MVWKVVTWRDIDFVFCVIKDEFYEEESLGLDFAGLVYIPGLYVLLKVYSGETPGQLSRCDLNCLLKFVCPKCPPLTAMTHRHSFTFGTPFCSVFHLLYGSQTNAFC